MFASFLGLCNFYSSLIPRFAELAAPFYRAMTLKEAPTREEVNELRELFGQLKTHITSQPVVRNPDHTKPFLLETDASQYSMGAVLKQGQPPNENPVGYFSRGLSKAEKNYTVYEKELYAVVRACEHFVAFLLGTHFILRTDHE